MAGMTTPETSATTATEVVDFWKAAGPTRWFAKNDDFDRSCKEKLLAAHERAAAGELEAWLDSPTGALALFILLDQLPRNAFRGTPRMFETDALARKYAARAIEAGHDKHISTDLRVFMYLPFEHSEDLADQDRSVALHEGLAEKPYADEHREIIRRFGRFPHRNVVLGRTSTAEEIAFLEGGGFGG